MEITVETSRRRINYSLRPAKSHAFNILFYFIFAITSDKHVPWILSLKGGAHIGNPKTTRIGFWTLSIAFESLNFIDKS